MKKHEMLSRHDEIRQSYRELGELGNLYDGIITRSQFGAI